MLILTVRSTASLETAVKGHPWGAEGSLVGNIGCASFPQVPAEIHLLVLSLLRWDRSDGGGEYRMSRGIDRPVFDRCACRVLAEKVVAFPVC